MKSKINFLYEMQATLTVLSYKIKNMHWNLKGKTFFEVHEELDKLFEDINELNDQVAEKIVMFDQVAIGSLKKAIEKSLIKEVEGQEWTVLQVSEIVSTDLNIILDHIEKIESFDFRIQPLVDEIVLSTHKWAWQFKKLSK